MKKDISHILAEHFPPGRPRSIIYKGLGISSFVFFAAHFFLSESLLIENPSKAWLQIASSLVALLFSVVIPLRKYQARLKKPKTKKEKSYLKKVRDGDVKTYKINL